MTRDQIIQRALRVIGDDSLTVQAAEWLDQVLLEIQSLFEWNFLQAGSSQTLSVGVDSYAVPSNYNKRMVISMQEPSPDSNNLGLLQEISYSDFMEIRDTTGTEESVPRFFAISGTGLFVSPRPGKAYILNEQYYKKITLPTLGADALETVTGIPVRWHQYLINGVIAEGFRYVDDVRQDSAKARFAGNLLAMTREEEQRVSPNRFRGFRSPGGLPIRNR